MEHTRTVIRATFPLDDQTISVLFDSPQEAERAIEAGLHLVSGLPVKLGDQFGASPSEVLLNVEGSPRSSLFVDQVVVGRIGGESVGPRFIHGIQSPMELKVPHTEARFPFGPTLTGVHVSVACCTGCNGGVHDRGLVVLNNHTGGSWSGIWVRSRIDMPDDYARWQKVAFLGGVLRDEAGSTTVRDEGWMRVRLAGEVPHSPPPPAHVSTRDFPAGGSRSLLARSLEACWVEFTDITVVDARKVEPGASHKGTGPRLPRIEIRFTDASGVEGIAWLYQESAFGLAPGERLAGLRGFIHAEAPGHYILLGDKEEDLLRHEPGDLTSEDEIRRLLADRPATTRTYQVARELIGRLPLDTRRELREMDDAETLELADYLEVAVEKLDGPFRVVDSHCPSCERHITFLDFAKTATKDGPHQVAQLRDVLSGRGGAWITIRGRDGGRPVTCAGCGHSMRSRGGYSEYSSSSYAYA